MKNIFAFTQRQGPMPGYVSLNQHPAGEVRITVRSPLTGAQAEVPVPEDELRALHLALSQRFNNAVC